MFTTVDTFKYLHKEKKSTFIAHLMNFENFQDLLLELKKEHTKARHFVSATRYLNSYDQIVESFSDDGEPKGTSGMPTLKVLQGRELINVGIITVRYFGGTLLGSGGLVRAYSDSANFLIESAKLIEFIKKESKIIHIKYSNLSKFEHSAKNQKIEIEKLDFDEYGVKIRCSGERKNLADFLEQGF